MVVLEVFRFVRARVRRPSRAVLLPSILLASGCGLFGEFERQVAADIKDNPVILQHIGDISTIKIDWTATGDAPGEDVFVFHVRGSKGEGVLTAECVTVDADREDVVSGTLRLSSGDTVDLFPE
jgi:hypothetical protein